MFLYPHMEEKHQRPSIMIGRINPFGEKIFGKHKVSFISVSTYLLKMYGTHEMKIHPPGECKGYRVFFVAYL